MKFFVSKQTVAGDGSAVCILITTQSITNRQQLLAELKEEFGHWMFLGIKQYTKEDFINNFSQYIPTAVLHAIRLNPTNFLYKAALYIAEDSSNG